MSGLAEQLSNGMALEVRNRQGIEVRDPRGATQRTQWTSPTMPMVPEWDADQAWRLGVLANVVAYRCVQILAGNASTPPLVAGRNPRKVHDVNENAAITKLLGPPPGGPAHKLSARKLLRWTIAQQIVTGRRAWEIETATGREDERPIALWPLAPANLRAVPSTGGNEWFRLFAYGRYDQPVTFQPHQVFYGWDPAGNDFRQPESALQSARYDLSLVTLCDRYGMAFLRNNAVPASVITTTAFPNDQLRDNFRRQWKAEFGGVDNAGRTAFHEVDDEGEGPVGETIDIKVLGLSAKDSRLVEQRKAAMAEIAISLGVPWSKLDASGRTFDNAEVEDRTMWEERLLPIMTDLVDDINMQLAPRFGPEVVWFDLSDVRALQRKTMPITQQATVPALLFAQVMTIDEGRADYGLSPLPNGAGARVLTPDEIAALQGQTAGGGAMRDALAALEQRVAASEDRTAGGGSPPSPELPSAVETRVADPEITEQRRARIWRSSDAVATALEARWVRQWRRLFARQLESTLSRLRGKRGRQMLDEQRASDPAPQIDPSNIFDAAFWATETRQMVDGLYEETALAGLNRLSASFGVAFDLSAPYVSDFIEARANQLAGPVTDTTYDAIRLELVEGVQAGESIDAIADRIRTVFTTASDSRAATIARTEVVSAYNGASALGAAQLPADVVAGQEWIATRDARARPSHAAADGQVRSIGEPFEVGGAVLAYPGDPSAGAKNTVNCRCTVAFLTPDEMAAVERSRPLVDVRSAKAFLRTVRHNDDTFDLLGFRRGLQEVSAA